MRYRYPFLVLLSILVVGSCGSYRAFRPSGFPFTVKVISAHAVVIKPSLGIPLPLTLQAGVDGKLRLMLLKQMKIA